MLHWTIESGDDGDIVIAFDGEITRDVDLTSLLGCGSRVALDLGGVRRINSHGVLELMGFLGTVGGGRPVEARRCSVAVITQLNMIPLLQDLLDVRSLFAPLECPQCNATTDLLIDMDDLTTRPPEIPRRLCTRCGIPLELAEPADRYFAFLAGPAPA